MFLSLKSDLGLESINFSLCGAVRHTRKVLQRNQPLLRDSLDFLLGLGRNKTCLELQVEAYLLAYYATMNN